MGNVQLVTARPIKIGNADPFLRQSYVVEEETDPFALKAILNNIN